MRHTFLQSCQPGHSGGEVPGAGASAAVDVAAGAAAAVAAGGDGSAATAVAVAEPPKALTARRIQGVSSRCCACFGLGLGTLAIASGMHKGRTRYRRHEQTHLHRCL
jgi:hypothetical protein